MSRSVHAEIGKIDAAANVVGQRASRTIGAMQTSCIAPDRRQISWQQAQGGVVGRSGGLGQGRDHVTCAAIKCQLSS